MNATNQRLQTVSPAIGVIRDLTPQDRITLPSASISRQAIFLQMAAAQKWGAAEWSQLDAQTVSRAHPDSMPQTLERTEITCHFLSAPFQDRALAMLSLREIANSYATQGVELSTPNLGYASASFRAANPIAWPATLAAFHEVTGWIIKNLREAAELYLSSSGYKDTLPAIMAAISAPGNRINLQPAGVQRFASFMADTGVMERRPNGLAHLFFPEAVEAGRS